MFINTAIAITAVVLIAASSAMAGKNQNIRNVYANGVLPTGEVYSTEIYHQGTPMERLPIWRRGYYQGNDPDARIRLNLMRDGRSHAY